MILPLDEKMALVQKIQNVDTAACLGLQPHRFGVGNPTNKLSQIEKKKNAQQKLVYKRKRSNRYII